ncbi:MAG: flavin monoamine oxidase family protein [Pseudorhodoplanes sp.]
MSTLSRRAFIAATAGAAVSPALAQVRPGGDVDIAIVGAGAAGIAAARRVIAAGRRVVVLEAGARIGGRCITDTEIFGQPYDLGAHWIHTPDSNPLTRLSMTSGIEVYPAPRGQKLRIGRRFAREGEMEDFFAAVVRSQRAIAEAARAPVDMACAQAMPKDLAEWKGAVDFFLGPFGCGKDLTELSAADFARSAERDVDAFCRQGFGTLLTRLADGLPVERNAPVSLIDSAPRGGVEVTGAKGKITARAVIVTVSTNVLLGNAIRFAPDLPKRQLDALAKLTLGTYERIALELPGNPLGLRPDELVFEQASGPRTAAVLGNVSGTTLAYVDIGGSFARQVAEQGPGAMTDFALEWLSGLYGTDIRKIASRSHATQWLRDPLVQGAFSAAAVGGQPSRRILMEPLRERIFFAGEAVHETLWGTVGGAWESGERAAVAALRLAGIGEEPKPAPGRPHPRRQRGRPPQRPAAPGPRT